MRVLTLFYTCNNKKIKYLTLFKVQFNKKIPASDILKSHSHKCKTMLYILIQEKHPILKEEKHPNSNYSSDIELKINILYEKRPQNAAFNIIIKIF